MKLQTVYEYLFVDFVSKVYMSLTWVKQIYILQIERIIVKILD